MPVIEIQRVPGMPKDRAEVEAGTVFYDWLVQESFHRDIRINVNGKELQPEEELGFVLQENDRVVIFDQPKSGGLIGTILNPLEHLNPIKFTQKVLSADAESKCGRCRREQQNVAKQQPERPDQHCA